MTGGISAESRSCFCGRASCQRCSFAAAEATGFFLIQYPTIIHLDPKLNSEANLKTLRTE